MRLLIAPLLAMALSSFPSPAPLRAQSIETPIAFDSARRVLAITPRMAERLHLSLPAWPIAATDYREVRLYAAKPGDSFVLVILRVDGSQERLPITDTARGALQSAIDDATAITGRPSAEGASDVVSEPAGNAFARHQTFLAAVAYAPVAASLADDASVGGALYLLTTGMTFFVSYAASQSTPFTRAQNDLAGSLGLAAGSGAGLAGYAATGASDRGVRAVALGSALVGTVVGANAGRSLTDAEAHAAAFGIENGAAVGVLGTSIGGLSSRTMAAAAAVGGAVGLPIGISYPRRASYAVTAGDVEVTSTASLIGTMAGAAALGGFDNPSSRQVAGFLAGGYLIGGIAGDVLLARPYDFTQSQATIINVGAIAGAVVGAVIPVAATSNNVVLDFGAPAVGAAIGAAIVVGSLPSLAEAGTRIGALRMRSTSRVHLSFEPLAIAAIGGRLVGRHVLARLSF